MLMSKSHSLHWYSAPLPIHSINYLSVSSSHLSTQHCLCLSFSCTVCHSLPIFVILSTSSFGSCDLFPLIHCQFLMILFFFCFTPNHIYPPHYSYPHKTCNPIYFIIDVLKNASLGFSTITASFKSRICILVSVSTVLEKKWSWSQLLTTGRV